MELHFTKMHGLGNDYIYINCFKTSLENPNEVARQLSRRHFSVGSDGLVMICPSSVADAKMRMFNADGSEGRMCGNALRCVGKYIYDNNIAHRETVRVETLSGIKTLHVEDREGKAFSLTADLGKVNFEPETVPVASDTPFIDQEFTCAGRSWRGTAVCVGTGHNVIFTENVEELDFLRIGPEFENHPLFPDRVNTEFVRVLSPEHLFMRVWERGSGETLACGTGASASAAVAVKLGISPSDKEIRVTVLGGDLFITVKKDFSILMRGEAATVFEGTINI